jgi:hypothetical protein
MVGEVRLSMQEPAPQLVILAEETAVASGREHTLFLEQYAGMGHRVGDRHDPGNRLVVERIAAVSSGLPFIVDDNEL